MIVELVYQTDEASGRILFARIQNRNIAHKHCVIKRCQLDIVVLATRALAQICKIKPNDALAELSRIDRTSFNQ